MRTFHKIVSRWRDAVDLTQEEIRKIIEQEIAWAEEDHRAQFNTTSEWRKIWY